MGYDGVVITDSLRMTAITSEYKPAAAAVRAIQAGADILLAASVFHFKMIGIPELKAYLAGLGVDVIR